MLYMIGTLSETEPLETRLPEAVFDELLRGIAVLDSEYGIDRDYRLYGGYSLVAETAEDVQKAGEYIDIMAHPCEWVRRIGEDGDYLCALYVLNNDFSIMLYLPMVVAPAVILAEMED